MAIDLAALTDADVGRAVSYRPYVEHAAEEGVITSWNKEFIFVRYGTKTNSQATHPWALSWSEPPPPADGRVDF